MYNSSKTKMLYLLTMKMKFLKRLTTFYWVIPLLLIMGCASRKEMVYFQGEFNETDSTAYESPQLVYKKGDFLHIQVSGVPEELSSIYNPDRSISREAVGGSYRNDNAQTTGYLIDSEGNINFPVIGKIKAAEKTNEQLNKLIKTKLQDHLENPIINIRLRNFKITVLGDVQNPGTFTVSNEQITILEAIGVAGDLNITARRDNVLLVREENGDQNQYRIDLTSNDVFNSSNYYLQQNDVIYVEPNRTKLNTSKYSPVYSVLISVTSLIITTIILITNN